VGKTTRCPFRWLHTYRLRGTFSKDTLEEGTGPLNKPDPWGRANAGRSPMVGSGDAGCGAHSLSFISRYLKKRTKVEGGAPTMHDNNFQYEALISFEGRPAGFGQKGGKGRQEKHQLKLSLEKQKTPHQKNLGQEGIPLWPGWGNA